MRLGEMAGLQAVLVQRFCQGIHLRTSRGHLRGAQLPEQVGRYDTCQQADDDDHDQKLQESETAGCSFAGRGGGRGFLGHGRKMNSQSL
ncbi:hypothetical protein D9M69_497570 [compost metagenome]